MLTSFFSGMTCQIILIQVIFSFLMIEHLEFCKSHSIGTEPCLIRTEPHVRYNTQGLRKTKLANPGIITPTAKTAAILGTIGASMLFPYSSMNSPDGYNSSNSLTETSNSPIFGMFSRQHIVQDGNSMNGYQSHEMPPDHDDRNNDELPLPPYPRSDVNQECCQLNDSYHRNNYEHKLPLYPALDANQERYQLHDSYSTMDTHQEDYQSPTTEFSLPKIQRVSSYYGDSAPSTDSNPNHHWKQNQYNQAMQPRSVHLPISDSGCAIQANLSRENMIYSSNELNPACYSIDSSRNDHGSGVALTGKPSEYTQPYLGTVDQNQHFIHQITSKGIEYNGSIPDESVSMRKGAGINYLHGTSGYQTDKGNPQMNMGLIDCSWTADCKRRSSKTRTSPDCAMKNSKTESRNYGHQGNESKPLVLKQTTHRPMDRSTSDSRIRSGQDTDVSFHYSNHGHNRSSNAMQRYSDVLNSSYEARAARDTNEDDFSWLSNDEDTPSRKSLPIYSANSSKAGSRSGSRFSSRISLLLGSNAGSKSSLLSGSRLSLNSNSRKQTGLDDELVQFPDREIHTLNLESLLEPNENPSNDQKMDRSDSNGDDPEKFVWGDPTETEEKPVNMTALLRSPPGLRTTRDGMILDGKYRDHRNGSTFHTKSKERSPIAEKFKRTAKIILVVAAVFILGFVAGSVTFLEKPTKINLCQDQQLPSVCLSNNVDACGTNCTQLMGCIEKKLAETNQKAFFYDHNKIDSAKIMKTVNDVELEAANTLQKLTEPIKASRMNCSDAIASEDFKKALNRYHTIQELIGTKPNNGSLMDYLKNNARSTCEYFSKMPSGLQGICKPLQHLIKTTSLSDKFNKFVGRFLVQDAIKPVIECATR